MPLIGRRAVEAAEPARAGLERLDEQEECILARAARREEAAAVGGVRVVHVLVYEVVAHLVRVRVRVRVRV